MLRVLLGRASTQAWIWKDAVPGGCDSIFCSTGTKFAEYMGLALTGDAF
jgi:hypothetical protein